jgi:hypothetical protein
VVTNGFYEWRTSDRQPFAVGMADEDLMVMAGLWDTGNPINVSQPPLMIGGQLASLVLSEHLPIRLEGSGGGDTTTYGTRATNGGK